MSEYQYYEFCKMNMPLTAEARKEMYALSSRAKVTTHGASYVYHYGDFRGNPKELLLKHFNVFFYISNWGCLQLMLKYSTQEVDADELKKYCVQHIINCEIQNSHVVLDINFSNEDGFGWVEGDGMLPDLLPLYDEIKSGNHRFLQLVACASHGDPTHPFKIDPSLALSQAQEAFFKYTEIV
jgi:hypothetical protein